MTEFPKITGQAKGIAGLYKWLGLYSIPLLTIVTIISISNVFTRGQIANDPRLQTAWAIIFAAAIEVNIVRLFFEWKLDRDNGALWLGIGLVFVAGVALLIEGLQQSIGFGWGNFYLQFAVGSVIALRVFVVVLLLAREGSKLAFSVVESEHLVYACPVHFTKHESIQPVYTDSEQGVITEVNSEANTPVNTIPFTSKHLTVAQKRVLKVFDANRNASMREIAKKAKVSPGYASQIIKSETGKMPAIEVVQVPATNGRH